MLSDQWSPEILKKVIRIHYWLYGPSFNPSNCEKICLYQMPFYKLSHSQASPECNHHKILCNYHYLILTIFLQTARAIQGSSKPEGLE